MINIEAIREGMNIKESKVLAKMKQAGETKMYNYLSGIDPDSSYTGENVKSIMAISGEIEWQKVEDPTNALFNIGYSEQGNIIGILTNANALLQDMLLYCTLSEAKENLERVLSIGVGSNRIIGKRYAVNGQSPLTFALPVITSGGYKSYAVVIHNKHADQFISIMQSIDIDSLDEEDMLLIAKDISFISRTQELAIDVAKDKTIQIVDTSEWLQMGVKPSNYWLAKQKDSVEGWYAKDNIYEIIAAKKSGDLMPDFKITKAVPQDVLSKISKEVVTSESIAREVLKKALEDYYNNHYKEMLLYSQETELNITAKSLAIQNKELSDSIKHVLMAYRSYMIDNMPKGIDDQETGIVLRKIARDKIDAFGVICRNTIYHLGINSGYGFKDIAMVSYGTDLNEVSKDEGKYFRAIMPEEFKKLYAQGKTAVSRERLFFVDELTQDSIDDGDEIFAEFKDGKAYMIGTDTLIAKASHKFNTDKAKLVFDDISGHFYAEQDLGIDLPSFGNEILLRVDGVTKDTNLENQEVTYRPKTENNSNVITLEDEYSKCTLGVLGYYGQLTTIQQAMLLSNDVITKFLRNKQFDQVRELLNSVDRVNKAELYNNITILNDFVINKDSEYEAQYVKIAI